MMYPLYKQLSTTFDDFDKRVDIILLAQEKLIVYKDDKLRSTCKPKFLLCMEGRIKEEIHGANLPELSDKISKLIPLSY